MYGLKAAVAKQLGHRPGQVRTVSRYVGGAFGSRGGRRRGRPGSPSRRGGGRPVKLVPTRDQGFTIATYRAETRQHVRLGATRTAS